LTAAEQLFNEERQCNLYIVKQRSGRTGNIPFTFKSKYTLFEEHPKHDKDQEAA
jgi:replicative DNA helicase